MSFGVSDCYCCVIELFTIPCTYASVPAGVSERLASPSAGFSVHNSMLPPGKSGDFIWHVLMSCMFLVISVWQAMLARLLDLAMPFAR